MSDPELALLGHLIGDGCTLPRHAIQYTTREPELAALVADLAEQVFGDAVAPRVKAERSWYPGLSPGNGAARPTVSATRLRRGSTGSACSGSAATRSACRTRCSASRSRRSRRSCAISGRRTAACAPVTSGRIRSCATTPPARSSRDGVVSLLLRLGITAGRRVVSMGAEGTAVASRSTSQGTTMCSASSRSSARSEGVERDASTQILGRLGDAGQHEPGHDPPRGVGGTRGAGDGERRRHDAGAPGATRDELLRLDAHEVGDLARPGGARRRDRRSRASCEHWRGATSTGTRSWRSARRGGGGLRPHRRRAPQFRRCEHIVHN